MELEPDELFKKISPNSNPSMIVTLGDERKSRSWAIPDNQNNIIKQA